MDPQLLPLDSAMRRNLPFRRCERRRLPNRLRAQILLRQGGRCFDCGTRLILGKFVFDHRPPLALRVDNENPNDPNRLVAICSVCDRQKTPRDIKEIARAKRLALNHEDHLERMREKVPGRPVPSKSQWKKLLRTVERPIAAPAGGTTCVGDRSENKHDDG
jgi:hypothetical protein